MAQEPTRRKRQSLIGLVADTEERPLRLPVLLRIEETPEGPPDERAEGDARGPAASSGADLIDQLFQEVRRETASLPGSGADEADEEHR